MKHKIKVLGILMMMSLPLMAITCVQIEDTEGRKKQVKNASNSASQFLILKKIEKIKKEIESTHEKMYQLQDSINESLFHSFTVRDMKFAQIDKEVKDVEMLKNGMNTYLNYNTNDPYYATIEAAFNTTNFNDAANKIVSNILLPGGLTKPLPINNQSLKDMEAGRHLAQHAFIEFADKRALQSATIMRQWADIYKEKATELNQALQQNKRFAMTDFERIRLQREAEKFVVLSYQLIEKSDSISLAVAENEDKLKRRAETALTRYNSLIQYYQK